MADSSRSRSTSEDTPPVYYCHQCSRQSSNVGEDFTCPHCNSGFLEIIENPSDFMQPGDNSSQDEASNFNTTDDFDSFLRVVHPILRNFLEQPQTTGQGSPTQAQAQAQAQSQAQGPGQQGTPLGADAPSSPQQPSQQMPQMGGLQGFLHNLFQGLTNGGTFQVQFHIDNGEGGGNAFAFPFQLHGNAADYAWGPGGLDAIVTQLLNQVQGGTPPMPRDKIDTLPDVTITKEQGEKHLQCAVCMDDFKIDEKACQLACEHLFHRDCITPWLERHNSCPVCRKSAETGLPPEPASPTFVDATTGTNTGGGNGQQTATSSSSANQNQPPQSSSANRRQQPNSRPQWMDIEDLD